MEKREVNTPAGEAARPVSLSPDRIVAAVWESAVQAFVKGIVVSILGSVVIGVAGSIWEEMVPSAPPGFTTKPEAETAHSSIWHSLGAALDHHAFLVVFGVIFVPTLWFRLAEKGTGVEAEGGSRLHKMGRTLFENWFGLLVLNAFGAIVSAIIVTWVQQFTLVRILFGWLLDSLVAGAQHLADSIFGTAAGTGIGAWWDWYGENQFKFNFWLLYLAAICDDLGLPNFKTLGRWLGRKVRQRKKKTRLNAED